MPDNKWPDTFAEDWGKLQANMEHVKWKVDSISQDMKVLPCKQAKDNPVTQINNVKRDLALIKGIGATIAGGIGTAIVLAWRKITIGGG